MLKNIKTAFRIYSSTDSDFGLLYNYSPVNASHPEVLSIRLLGSVNHLSCQLGEFCPDANIFHNGSRLDRSFYLN